DTVQYRGLERLQLIISLCNPPSSYSLCSVVASAPPSAPTSFYSNHHHQPRRFSASTSTSSHNPPHRLFGLLLFPLHIHQLSIVLFLRAGCLIPHLVAATADFLP